MLAHGYVTERLDGSTPPDQRQQRVNDFNNSRGVFAFLISTTAGGKREGGASCPIRLASWVNCLSLGIAHTCIFSFIFPSPLLLATTSVQAAWG